MNLFPAYRGQVLEVSHEENAMLAESFPEVDRPSEYRSADAWLWANPRRRPKNYRRFLVNWFSRQKRREIARPEDEAVIDGARVRLTSAERRKRQDWINY